ncbi:MAG: hypothetical protein EAZ43_05850 [Betaproteobacteria bacterium]|nr:MAG: hypothetical protein EAZ43_05850 [Betaproteobacteria bacterium]
MDKSIVVPIGLFLAVVYTIKLLVDARMRYLFFKAGAPDTVEALFRGEERLRRMSTLRWGAVLLVFGLGLAVAAKMELAALGLPSLALMVLTLGVGNLAAYFAARSLELSTGGLDQPQHRRGGD